MLKNILKQLTGYALSEKNKYIIVYLISLSFVAFNAYLITKDIYWGLLLPVLIVIGMFYIYSLDKILLIITFLTPLAINFRDYDIDVGVSLPTEPMMLGVLLLFIFKLFYDNQFDRKVTFHRVSIAIFIYLFWILITSITSELPLVSFKFFFSRLWFIVPFYFIGTQLFRKISTIKLFSWLYIIPLLIVIAYTIIQHSSYGFDEKSGHFVMTPFYNDHTAYGAALAMFVPVVVGFIFNKQYQKKQRIISFFVLVVLLIALTLSFCRAAWISLIFAFGVYILIILKIKFKWIAFSVISIIGLFFAFQWQILDALEKNKQDSSANFVEHIQSITNISSDASNLERINRWQSALRMYNERPFLGWGPGTYQFVYAPFQRSKEKTIISTNAGDMGNAHSEYIGPLAETGFIGMLTVFGILITVVYSGLNVYKKAKSREIKLISLVTLLALITYYFHGIMNNFLDTDKAAVPFWGFIAIIVALDIYHNEEEKNSVIKS